jgi:hypothetical protein
MNDTTCLFKYMDASKLELFEKSLLLLTPPIYLNDPWDFRPRGRTPTEDEIRQVWREIETDISQTSVIAVPADYTHREQQARLANIRAGATNKAFLADLGEHYQSEIGNFVGIVSLTELPLSRLMWAHYADSHAGFIAELAAGEEGNFEGFVIRGVGTGLVAAKVKYPRSFDQISFASDGSNVLEVCWSKHPLWEYEQEWRIVAPLACSVTYRLISAAGKEQGTRFCVPFKPWNLRR